MKKTAIVITLILMSSQVFSQVNFNGTAGNMLILSIGVNKTFINNPNFDSWTRSNYNKTINESIDINLDLTLISKSYDFGIHLDAPYPYGIGAFYFGKRLTSTQSKISSFLNLEIGSLESMYSNISPVNYTPTEAQKGKELQLHYNATYIGLSSKNYINGLSFKSGKGKKGASYNCGFYADFGYEPWGGDWEYGYYTGSGKYAQFHSQKVYGIPHLNNVFVDTGIFIGIGS